MEHRTRMATTGLPKKANQNYRSYTGYNNSNNDAKATETVLRENLNNVLIQKQDIEQILSQHGLNYTINNLAIWQKAFVHPTYLIDNDNPEPHVPGAVPLQPESFERLEYIGDAMLNAATAHYVFNRYPKEDEGFMTTLRTKLVRTKTLARLSKKIKLHRFILLSQYAENVLKWRNNRTTLEDVFEAFIGALYTDSDKGKGYDNCLIFVSNAFEQYIDIATLIDRDDNYKKNLLEYYQKRFKTEAKYQIISVRGKKSQKIYTMGALSPTGEIIGIGQAKKKVDADQMASKQALIYYDEPVEESEEDSIDE